MIKVLWAVIGIIFYLTSPAFAAIAMLDAVESANPTACGGAGTCDLSAMTISAGSNRKLICAVAAEDSATTYDVNGVAINSVALTAAVQGQTPTDQNIAELWYLDDVSLPSPGDYTVTVDFTEDVSTVLIACWTVSGIAQGAPKDTDQVSSDTDAGLTFTLSLTGIVGTDWVFTVAGESNGSSTWTHGGSQTELFDVDFGSMTAAGSRGAGVSGPSSTRNETFAVRTLMVGAAWAEAASGIVPTSPIFFQ